MSSPVRKQDQKYTYKDYCAWDDNERWELIDGIPYNMSPAPLRKHQEVSGILFYLFFNYLKGKKCRIYAAPFDVRFPEAGEADNDITTVVQPDIVVVCDESKLDEKGMRGPPDLIVEITSPHTSRRDLKDKFDLYENRGVREYWIIHPFEETVMVYQPDPAGKTDKAGETGNYGKAKRYAGNDKIQTGIFQDLIIDLDVVFDRERSKS